MESQSFFLRTMRVEAHKRKGGGGYGSCFSTALGSFAIGFRFPCNIRRHILVSIEH